MTYAILAPVFMAAFAAFLGRVQHKDPGDAALAGFLLGLIWPVTLLFMLVVSSARAGRKVLMFAATPAKTRRELKVAAAKAAWERSHQVQLDLLATAQATVAQLDEALAEQARQREQAAALGSGQTPLTDHGERYEQVMSQPPARRYPLAEPGELARAAAALRAEKAARPSPPAAQLEEVKAILNATIPGGFTIGADGKITVTGEGSHGMGFTGQENTLDGPVPTWPWRS